MPRFVTVGKQTRAGRRRFSLSLSLVNFLTYRFDASPFPAESPAVNLRQKISGIKWYDEAVPYSAAGSGEFTGTVSFGLSALDCHLQGPSHLVLHSLLLFIGSVSSGAVLLSVHLQGPCHLNFFCKSPKNVRLYIDSSMKATL